MFNGRADRLMAKQPVEADRSVTMKHSKADRLMTIRNKSRAVIILMLALIMVCTMFSGCKKKGKTASKEEFIQESVRAITAALESEDPDELYSLFAEENRTDDLYADVSRAVAARGPADHVYITYSGYDYGDGVEDGYDFQEVNNISGIIVSGGRAFTFYTDFTGIEDTGLIVDRLWVITDKTEATENADWGSKYHFDKSETFEFADYYDSGFTGEWRQIWGKIIQWNEDSDTLEADDLGDDATGMPLEEFTAKYGRPGGVYDTVYGYHILFYKTSEEGKYTKISLADDDKVEKVEYTDNIGYGKTGTEEMQ